MNGYDLVRLQPKQVLKTGDTMTGNLTMSGGARFIGNLTGNADTSTRLQTARTINGTSFNGSADIITSQWGNARNITISDNAGTNTGAAVSVNGSANVTLKLPTTIAATISGNATTATRLQTARSINGTSFNGSADITTAQWGQSRNIYVSDADGTNTGVAVSVNGSANATLKLPATIKGNLTGNASTTTTLQTARTINGTSFNGGADIVTNYWGTARNITIGGRTQSVNGSQNMVWSLNDILTSPTSINIYADNDNNSNADYLSLKAGNNTVKIMSEGTGGIVGGDLLTLTSKISTYAGDVIKFSDSQKWKSIDLYRTDGVREGIAKFGVGRNDANLTASLELHTDFNSSVFYSKLDLSKNSLGLISLGDSAGDQTAWLGFYSGENSNLANRYGYVGRGDRYSSNIALFAEKGLLQLRSSYDGSRQGVCCDTIGYFRPENPNAWACGHSSYRWSTVYYTNLNAPSDRNLKENIEYIAKDSNSRIKNLSITEKDLYDFIKDDLNLAKYDYKTNALFNVNEEDKAKNKIGFIAQDIKDTKIGKMFIKIDEVVETPSQIGGDVAGISDEVYHAPNILPTDTKELYSYDLTDYVNILAGALKTAINKIESLETELSQLIDGTTTL